MSRKNLLVTFTIDQETFDILKIVGKGNRSKGVRLLAQQYTASEKADIRNEMDVIVGELDEHGKQKLLPVPGLPTPVSSTPVLPDELDPI